MIASQEDFELAFRLRVGYGFTEHPDDPGNWTGARSRRLSDEAILSRVRAEFAGCRTVKCLHYATKMRGRDVQVPGRARATG